MIGTVVFVVLSMLFCVAFCVLRAEKATGFSLTLKTLASLAFIFAGIIALQVIGFSVVGLLILLGMICGLAGDILLDLKVMYPARNTALFLSGTASFAVGHAFYFSATLLYILPISTAMLAWALPVAVVLAVMATLAILFASKKMGMDFQNVKWAVIAYSIILTFMFFFTVFVAIYSPIFWIFAGGMLLFLLSDLVLSMQYFGGRGEKIFIYINHILYYLAQCMFALFMIFGL